MRAGYDWVETARFAAGLAESHADPAKAPHHDDRALFGGWRIEDIEGK